MARKRASDTAALVAAPSGGHNSVHIHTEKIDNGFLVHTYKSGPAGYQSSTRFHETEPKIVAKAGRAPPSGAGACGDSSLCGATEHLKD